MTSRPYLIKFEYFFILPFLLIMGELSGCYSTGGSTIDSNFLSPSPTLSLPSYVSPCTPGKTVLSYTGSNQSFTLPPTCSGSPTVYVKLWGAGGGATSGTQGGGGGYVSSVLTTQPNQNYTVIVGGGGQYAMAGALSLGGFGGGGNGNTGLNPANTSAGGGGGRSAIKLGSLDLITAGGGGGGASFGLLSIGGAGGGLTGLAAVSGGQGGTQIAGGNGGMDWSGGTSGTTGTQYQGGQPYNYGGGGGGGYYGGGGGCTPAGSKVAGGGGGSSYYQGNGVTFAKTVAGSGQNQGNPTDIDNQGSGLGGNGNGSSGANGQVIIYYGAAQIAELSSYSGSSAGGVPLTLYGLGFVAGSTSSLGLADIVLSVPGAQTVTLSGAYFYTP